MIDTTAAGPDAGRGMRAAHGTGHPPPPSQADWHPDLPGSQRETMTGLAAAAAACGKGESAGSGSLRSFQPGGRVAGQRARRGPGSTASKKPSGRKRAA